MTTRQQRNAGRAGVGTPADREARAHRMDTTPQPQRRLRPPSGRPDRLPADRLARPASGGRGGTATLDQQRRPPRPARTASDGAWSSARPRPDQQPVGRQPGQQPSAPQARRVPSARRPSSRLFAPPRDARRGSSSQDGASQDGASRDRAGRARASRDAAGAHRDGAGASRARARRIGAGETTAPRRRPSNGAADVRADGAGRRAGRSADSGFRSGGHSLLRRLHLVEPAREGPTAAHRSPRQQGKPDAGRDAAGSRTATVPQQAAATPWTASQPWTATPPTGTTAASGTTPATTRSPGFPVSMAMPRMPFVLLVLALLGGGLVCLLVVNTTLGAASFRISQLQQRNANLALQEQNLQDQIQRETGPAQIADRAYQLGMRTVTNTSILDLRKHRTYQLAGDAGATSVTSTTPTTQLPTQPKQDSRRHARHDRATKHTGTTKHTGVTKPAGTTAGSGR
jgi:hypothetical protein